MDVQHQAEPRDRRREDRQPMELVVLFSRLHESPTATPPAETTDASRNGMFVATEKPLPPRTLVQVEAFPALGEERPVRAQAIVRWRRRWRAPRGMGLELLRVGEGDRQRLASWLREADRAAAPAEEKR